MTMRTTSMLLGSGLLLVALDLQLATGARPSGPAETPLPTLASAEMGVALRGSCGTINVTQASFCGAVSGTNGQCTPATAPATCCTTTKAFTCPTTQGWNSNGGQAVNGTATTPTCPVSAVQETPCNCISGRCTSGMSVPKNCTGGTYGSYNNC